MLREIRVYKREELCLLYDYYNRIITCQKISANCLETIETSLYIKSIISTFRVLIDPLRVSIVRLWNYRAPLRAHKNRVLFNR